MKKLILGMAIMVGLLIASVGTARVSACSDALYWCGIDNPDTGKCESADPVATKVACNAVSGSCYPAGSDPCHPRGMCIASVMGCEGGIHPHYHKESN